MNAAARASTATARAVFLNRKVMTGRWKIVGPEVDHEAAGEASPNRILLETGHIGRTFPSALNAQG